MLNFSAESSSPFFEQRSSRKKIERGADSSKEADSSDMAALGKTSGGSGCATRPVARGKIRRTQLVRGKQ